MTRRRSALACVFLFSLVMVIAGAASAAPARQTAAITPAPAFTATDLAQRPADDWISVGGNLQDERYSQLDQITRSNVSGLKVAWATHMEARMATTRSRTSH